MTLEWPDNLLHSTQFSKEYKSLRTSMLIVMQQAQKPLAISCGGFFVMGKDKYTALVRNVYSMAMFVWNVKYADDGEAYS